MRGLHSVERVLKIIGMTATSHHELDADTVNNKAALVNILLGTTVYPGCTRAQVATLSILRSDIDVRNKLALAKDFLIPTICYWVVFLNNV